MAERTHFYNEANVHGRIRSATYTNAVFDGSPPAQILGSALSANTKYLIIARALFSGDDVGTVFGCRVQTDDDIQIHTKSEMLMEPMNNQYAEGVSYLFVHSFTTDASPSDVEFQLKGDGVLFAAARLSSLFLLDLDAIAPKYYFDASDAGPTDSSGNWNNDANAFDGLTTSTSPDSTGATGNLSGEGTTAPTSGDSIAEVKARFFGADQANDLIIQIHEDNVGGTTLLNQTFNTDIAASWSDWFTVTAPSGGWTWQKINDLAVQIDPSNTGQQFDMAEVQVFLEGKQWFEDIQPVDSGTEYSTSTANTILAEISGADMGTDEHIILAYARADIGSTGRWYRHDVYGADDDTGGFILSFHQAEGEDTSEQRISGFALRHKASSGTPNCTLYGQEEAANANALDGGAYMIALPSALFADFEAVFNDNSIAVDGTETLMLQIASYTPSVSGNHLVICRANGFNCTALGGMWVESGTTEIRTGDSTPTHNQIWDSAKDLEQMVTFQRYSITGTETLNLRGQGAGADFDAQDRWMLIINLDDGVVAGSNVYPPFPHRTPATVRM